MARDEGGRGRYVNAVLEQPSEHVDVGPERVVGDAIGLERDQGIDVVAGLDADRVEPGEGADVLSQLVGAMGEAADELEIGMRQDRPDGSSPDVARGPLNDATYGVIGLPPVIAAFDARPPGVKASVSAGRRLAPSAS